MGIIFLKPALKFYRLVLMAGFKNQVPCAPRED
jgi:hypothetical protein